MRTSVLMATFAVMLMAVTAQAATVAGNGDGLIKVNVINTIGPNPGNNTANWLSVWNALDGGAGPTGTVAGFNVQHNTKDVETVYDYAGGGGNFGVNNAIGTINGDGPGGGSGPFAPVGSGGSNYSIRGQTFIEFNQAGTYTIALGSDDGRRIELTEARTGSAPGFNGFTSRAGQVNGAFAAGDTVIGFSGGTGHNRSLGVFNVAMGDILRFDGFMYEGGGGDSAEISIAAIMDTSFDTTNFQLLTDGVHNGAISIHSVLIPEPTTAVLGLMGLAGLVTRRRRAA